MTSDFAEALGRVLACSRCRVAEGYLVRGRSKFFKKGSMFSYGATAVRPSWRQLPPAMRQSIASSIGFEPTWSSVCTGGFTNDVALLVGRSEPEFFLKAHIATTGDRPERFDREVLAHSLLPESVPAPRLRHVVSGADGIALVFTAAPGLVHDQPQPFTVAEVAVRLARALEPVDTADLQNVRPLSAIAQDDEVMGYLDSSKDVSQLPAPAQRQLERVLPVMRSLLADAPAAVDGTSLCHGDLRADNMVWTGDDAQICDWASICRAQPWTDGVHALVDHGEAAEPAARASGLLSGADPVAVDSYLTLLIAYMLCDHAAPVPPGSSPHLRAHQVRFAAGALSWLACRTAG